MYLWAQRQSVSQIISMSGISRPSAVQYLTYMRDVASWKILQDAENFIFGGPNVVVQVDESVITQCKYNKGRVIKQRWVLGIYDTAKKRGVIIYVAKRNKETLILAIQKYVAVGSIIWTDKWRVIMALATLDMSTILLTIQKISRIRSS